ncbi:hypothetical protein L9F63_013497 [Diploptera punctata]|uniref:Mevalonate kinase n=1 Tax=Diploptera punctata TaxID=6984 RepID=A0AAD8ELL7_DIPPU|nr:hypothetical protein L9F63_013497 [Diploptera punctata]
MNASDIRFFNWKTPQFINMPEMDNKITNFLLPDERKRTPGQTLALKTCIFLYSGIFSSLVVRVKPMSITVTSKIKVGFKLGSYQAYCVAMAAAFIHYLKCRVMTVQRSKDKKMFKNTKVDLTDFTAEEKEAIRMWACCASYFRSRHNSGSGVYCSTYGSMHIYTSKEVPWKNEVEQIDTLYNPSILLVDIGVPCDQNLEEVKVEYRKAYPGLYHAACLLSSRCSVTLANIMRQVDSTINSKQNQEKITTIVAEKSKLIAKLFFLNQGLIKCLTFSHPKAQEVLEMAYSLDLRGFLVGSAQGGMVCIFIPPFCTEEAKLKELYKKANFKFTANKMGVPGVSVTMLSETSNKKHKN